MSGGAGQPAEILVRPAAEGAAAGAAARVLGRPVREWAERTRTELGLPAGPVVGAGHQPEWWHPGIVAKFAWADERARRTGASLAWLVVDTDVRDPGVIRLPELRGGRLTAAEWRFAGTPSAGASPAGMPASMPRALPEPRADRAPALGCVADGLVRAREALQANARLPDAVAQVLAAVGACTPEVGAPAHVLRTSSILATGLGRALAAHALADPCACARAFNRAVGMAPRTARPLAESGPQGAELPFWTPGPDGRRMRVHADALGALLERGAPLWPRAFVTGLFARLALFDRFVHGTGGDAYERATDGLAASWLGAALPPFDVATATLRLPFPDAAIDPGPGDAALRAAWFDPERGAHGGPGPRKRALLEEIASRPRGSEGRRAAWRRMHEALGSMREGRREELRRLEEAAAGARERAREHAVRSDRTWPAVLHPPEAISRLASAIRSRPT